MVNLNLKLPEKFLDQEVRDGYTVPQKMKEAWAVELDLLNEFMRVCEKYNIKWFADAGTILGAARHKGMIPWDDDIDVMMFREEYDKLLAVAEKEFTYPYFLQTDQNSKAACRGHVQLRNSQTTGIITSEIGLKLQFNQGIFLDIFPIDSIPNDDVALQELIAEVSLYKHKISRIRSLTYRYKFKWRRNIVKLAYHFFLSLYYKSINKDEIIASFDKCRERSAQAYNGQQTKRVAKLCLSPIKERRIWQREWFDETKHLPFEMFYLPVPGNYEALLDTFYGDWRKFVVGTATHGGIFFDTDKPYTEYVK